MAKTTTKSVKAFYCIQIFVNGCWTLWNSGMMKESQANSIYDGLVGVPRIKRLLLNGVEIKTNQVRLAA